ncbi:conserved hypothetical protein [Talaromyces stipitatus ATCC 10500]|uniref:Septin-type G domain-containing protein n=1 Tax=Talaromyces stipitatus (strain ATCC 10500 / CBS 375.48 / QM 6759 / NRRL 1006) TaxID=441959 RepID=B8MFQ3_TALSN|nr:uncharacterized protein TSTA_021040 [Talaromyces stipitatus ATCC 10500]EED17043.1 conserved hypothetical protein [Talaromyces stipitatus ATCC 10500]
MRPVVPEFSPSPPRKLSSADPPAPSWSDGSSVPTSFFLAREPNDDDMAASRDSTYGVQSLEDTIHTADISCSFKDESYRRDVNDEHADPTLKRRTTLKPSDLLHHIDRLDTPLSKAISRASPVPSRPLTPFNLNDDPSSMPSSPKSISSRSFKPLDDISITDEINSQALVSGGEEEDAPEMSEHTHHGVSDSSSQLIMPSIRMPSRRPFTERGKNIGRFKILVAGSKGSGKSSLIKSIVQACEDIVHVDPGSSNSTESGRPRSRTNSKKSNAAMISEIHASTKPYPPWWSDLEDSRILKRRKNNGEVVLERNLCFVDTSASHNSKTNSDQTTEAIIQYMRQQLSRAIASVSHPSSDLQNMLGGNGGSQVDLILYLISEDTLPCDIECIRKLSDFSNVIPLISKADLLSASQIASLKSSFHIQIAQHGVRLFSFDDVTVTDGGQPQLPFAVSSAQSSDDDNMDASVLMSPDYVPPLVASEIGHLIEKVFDSDNMSWLRHSAAKKLTRSTNILAPNISDMALSRRQSRSRGGPTTCSNPASNNAAVPPISNFGGTPNYALARVNDYTQHEEKLAQVRLAKWAADLQQSLQNERERYAALARGERAAWLTERIGECLIDGTLVPIHQTPGFPQWDVNTDKDSGAIVVRTSNGQTARYRLTKLDPEDPLGLVRWNDDLRRRGWMIVQVVGSLGVVGGLALWLAKFWGLPAQSLSEWHFHWIDPQD